MTTAKIRLLVLSVGSASAQNVIDAIGARRAHCVLMGTNDVAEAAGNFRCDVAYLVPPTSARARYIERLGELIREEHPHLVVPCCDDDIVALATLCEQSPRGDAVLLTGTTAPARIMTDRIESARFAVRHGLPFAPTASNAREGLELAKEHGLPLIGKPRSGNKSPAVVLLRSAAELERAFASSPGLIVQPYLDAPSNTAAFTARDRTGLPFFFAVPETAVYAVQIVVGPGGTISNPSGILSTRVAGESVQIARCDDPQLLELGRAYARAVAAEGWKGALDVQCKRTPESGFVAFGLNGRFTGETAARVHLGFDLIGEVVRRFLAGTALPPVSASSSDVVQMYPRGYPVPREGVVALKTVGRWSSETGNAPPKSRPRTMRAKLRLLLLSVGSRVPQRFIDALGDRRDRCVLIGTNSVADAAGNFRSDTVYRVPPAAAGAAYIERVAELIREEQPDLVIPGRDDDVLALSVLGEQWPTTDAVLLTGTVAAARIMNDKVETACFAARHGLPFAPTVTGVRDALELAKSHRLPLIGKPRSGNASLGVVLLRSTEEIVRAFASSPDLIAQPYLDPPIDMEVLTATFDAGLPFFFSFPEAGLYVIQVIVGPDQLLSSLFGGVAIQVRGQAVQIARCDDPELLEVGRAYARAAAAEGWKGPLNVQLKRTPAGKFVAFELNGRFIGTMAERVHMGFDEIADVITRFLPGVDFPSIATSISDVGQRYAFSYPVPQEGVVALQTGGRWSGGGGIPNE